MGDVIPQFFISHTYIMKLVKTLLADGRFKVVDEDTKSVIALAISADKVDKFMVGARAILRTKTQKKADHERLVALSVGASKTLRKKK